MTESLSEEAEGKRQKKKDVKWRLMSEQQAQEHKDRQKEKTDIVRNAHTLRERDEDII